MRNRETWNPYPTTGDIDIETWEPIVPTVNDKSDKLYEVMKRLDPNEIPDDEPYPESDPDIVLQPKPAE